MKFFIFIITFALYANIIITDPTMNDYYISVNDAKCALISLQGDISVTYETTEGLNSVKLSMENISGSEEGICANDSGNKIAQFNITFKENEKLVFNFDNVNNEVILKNITFSYNLPNINFPNAKKKGTVIAILEVNTPLSTPSQFYQCFSYTNFNLSNDVTFNVYAIKLKVFNVENSTFGDSKAECPQDSLTTENVQTTSVATESMQTTVIPTETIKTTDLPTETMKTTLLPTETIKTTLLPTITMQTTLLPTETIKTTLLPTETMQTTLLPTVTMQTTLLPTETMQTTLLPTETIKTTLLPTETMQTTLLPTESSLSTVETTKHYLPTTAFTSTDVRSTTTSYRTTVSPTDPKFTIGDKTNICLLLQSKMTFSVTYETTKQNVELLFPVTSTHAYSGICSVNEDNITIHYPMDMYFVLSFTKTANLIKLNSFRGHAYLSRNYFPDAKNQNTTIEKHFTFGSLYEVSVGKGYSCLSNLTLGNAPMKLDVLDFKFEAFRTLNSTDFSDQVTTCKRDPIVAIIVGVVLAVFLIIVIIIFIIFQIRAKRRQGYQEI